MGVVTEPNKQETTVCPSLRLSLTCGRQQLTPEQNALVSKSPGLLSLDHSLHTTLQASVLCAQISSLNPRDHEMTAVKLRRSGFIDNSCDGDVGWSCRKVLYGMSIVQQQCASMGTFKSVKMDILMMLQVGDGLQKMEQPHQGAQCGVRPLMFEPVHGCRDSR